MQKHLVCGLSKNMKSYSTWICRNADFCWRLLISWVGGVHMLTIYKDGPLQKYQFFNNRIYSNLSIFSPPWTFSMCLFCPFGSINSLLHILQENFIPSWTLLTCNLRSAPHLKANPHSLQLWDFSCKWAPKKKIKSKQEK